MGVSPCHPERGLAISSPERMGMASPPSALTSFTAGVPKTKTTVRVPICRYRRSLHHTQAPVQAHIQPEAPVRTRPLQAGAGTRASARSSADIRADRRGDRTTRDGPGRGAADTNPFLSNRPRTHSPVSQPTRLPLCLRGTFVLSYPDLHFSLSDTLDVSGAKRFTCAGAWWRLGSGWG
jgi:hypothetical protein